MRKTSLYSGARTSYFNTTLEPFATCHFSILSPKTSQNCVKKHQFGPILVHFGLILAQNLQKYRYKELWKNDGENDAFWGGPGVPQ